MVGQAELINVLVFVRLVCGEYGANRMAIRICGYVGVCLSGYPWPLVEGFSMWDGSGI